MKIEKVWAREVLDSRGNPTVEAEITVSGHRLRAIAPSGASTGLWEARELRDCNSRFGGKGVQTAVNNIRTKIAKAIVNMDPTDQRAIDEAMIKIDSTENKNRLGANAITATSLAVAKAGALAEGLSLYEYIGDNGVTLPVPMLNVINGGKHAGSNLKIQEFMIVPIGAKSFSECLRMSSEVYMSLKSTLINKCGMRAINLGDEGGFTPSFSKSSEALETIIDAISNAGYFPGRDISLALDAASSEFYNEGIYDIDCKKLSALELADYYEALVKTYPIVSIEDPFFEDDFETTATFTKRVGSRIQVVGDDLFVTNTNRFLKGAKMLSANALLLKVNQIGTVTEAENTAYTCFKNGYSVIVSHRSGESEDVSIADLSVGWGTGQIKTGAPARGERTAKYNRLLRIEEELGSKAVFLGKKVFTL